MMTPLFFGDRSHCFEHDRKNDPRRRRMFGGQQQLARDEYGSPSCRLGYHYRIQRSTDWIQQHQLKKLKRKTADDCIKCINIDSTSAQMTSKQKDPTRDGAIGNKSQRNTRTSENYKIELLLVPMMIICKWFDKQRHRLVSVSGFSSLDGNKYEPEKCYPQQQTIKSYILCDRLFGIAL